MNLSRSLLFFASVFCLNHVQASQVQADDPVCRLKTGITEEHYLGTDLGYFAQPLGQHRIMFMGVPEADGARYPGRTETHVYDLRNRTTRNATRDLDPYPTPDGEFYVHPNPTEFFASSDIERLGEAAKPVGSFEDHLGWYESVGQFPDPKDGVATYRVITATVDKEMRLGSVRDYRPMTDPKMPGRRKIIAVNAKPIPVCSNVASTLPLALPILSRDGSRLSVYNGNTATTQIYKLSMPSGHCELELDIGAPTGKGAFSFDGTYFAAPGTFGDPSRATVVVVNLSDLKKPAILALPPRTGITATSATFLPNGDLLITANEREQGNQNLLFRIRRDSFHREPSNWQTKVASFLIQMCPREFAGMQAAYVAPFVDRNTCHEVARKEKGSLPMESCHLIPQLSRPKAPAKTNR
jgi:hypothetical protein